MGKGAFGMTGNLLSWLLNPASWQGPGGIPDRLIEHAGISLLSVTVGALLALPAGLYIGHSGRGKLLVVTLANIGRAVPSFAILALALPLTIRAGLGFGFAPTVIALVFLSIPPILVNAYVGVEQVDDDVIEAATGMGMSRSQVLTRVELPIATPLILAGLRTATVQVVATATLAALVAWGGLGRYVIDGFATRDNPKIFGGALLITLLALATEILFGGLQRLTRRGPTALEAAK